MIARTVRMAGWPDSINASPVLQPPMAPAAGEQSSGTGRGLDLESLYAKICENLPTLVFADPGFREEVLRISRDAYSPHEEFDARFERTLEELRQDRIEQRRKWDEQDRKWREQHQENMAILAEIRKSRQHQEQQLGAMGARWGTFRGLSQRVECLLPLHRIKWCAIIMNAFHAPKRPPASLVALDTLTVQLEKATRYFEDRQHDDIESHR